MPVVSCNQTGVKVIFQNLMTNALKYNRETEKVITIGCTISNNVPVFFVQDNGIGIPPEFHKYIFQPFKRLHGHKDFGGGSGIGLAITQKAIARQGGRIWVESKQDQGARFCFTLTPEPEADQA